jgi:transcriptional regulator with XRE-family HTH domain
MGTNKVVRGPVSERVAANVKALRTERRLTLDDLAGRMRDLGRPLLKSGLSKIESGERRVDVDDFAALAIALETNVNRLLLSAHAEADDSIEITPELASTSRAAWGWACGEYVEFAGPWPWAKFAEHGSKPNLRRFQEETRPHDPPLYLTPEDYERLQPLRRQLDQIFFDMKEDGFSPEDFSAVLRMFSGREVTFTGKAD